MRKKALKKADPQRGKKIKMLREASEGDTKKLVYDKKGNEVVLNVMKHFLFGESYQNEEYQKELERYAYGKISNQKIVKAEKEEDDDA